MRLRDVNVHKTRLDEFTSTILSKSNYTLQKIEENMRVTHQLRVKTSLIHSLDTRVNQLTTKLGQLQYVLTQLNSLLIRSEFFEKQLQMYESQQKVNQMRLLEGVDDDQMWKEDELNWKTSEATLENLWLEFRFLMRKVDAEVPQHDYTNLMSEASRRAEQHQQQFLQQQQQAQDSEPSTPMFTPGKSEITLRPIRCVSKRDKSKRRSLNLNLLSYSPSMLNSPLLSTPDSSFGKANVFSESFTNDQGVSLFAKQPASTPQRIAPEKSRLVSPPSTKSVKNVIETICSISPFSRTSESSGSPKSRHKRANSVPHSIFSVVMTKNDTYNIKTPTKAYLRHAISLEAGLTIKKRQQSVEEEVTKDSEWLNSPVTPYDGGLKDEIKKVIHRENKFGILTPDPTPDNSMLVEDCGPMKSIKEEEFSLQDLLQDSLRRQPEPIVEVEAKEEETIEKLPTFEHRLNRSNSCDSIFSAMTSRIPVRPMRDSKTQTMSWMQKFSNNRTPSVSAKPNNVNTLSVNNLSVSRGGALSRTALSNLVLQGKKSEPVSSPFFSSWFSTKKRAPSSTPTSTPTVEARSKPSPVVINTTTSENKHVTSPSPITIRSPDDRPVEPTHIYETLNHAQPKAWNGSNFLSMLNPQSLIPSNTMVTREVGRHVVQETSKHTLQGRKCVRAPLKGSFSTLTIGHNGSAIVQHGEGSMILQSSVVTSQVSQDELQEALASTFQFD